MTHFDIADVRHYYDRHTRSFISGVDYLRGGSALQECLANGWIGDDLTVFRRRG
jgi:hypothetical protein